MGTMDHAEAGRRVIDTARLLAEGAEEARQWAASVRSDLRQRVTVGLPGTATPTSALSVILDHLVDPDLLEQVIALKAAGGGAVPSCVDQAWVLTEDRERAAATILLLSRRAGVKT